MSMNPPTNSAIPTDRTSQQQDYRAFGIAALILGIVGFFMAIVVGPLSLPASILAIALGIVGLKAANRGELANKGLNITGIILGSVTIVLGLAMLAIGSAIFLSSFMESM